MKIVKPVDSALEMKAKSSNDRDKASLTDKNIIISDLIDLKPFKCIEGREHDGFPPASSDTLNTLDYTAFVHEWLNRHKKNLLKRAPVDSSSAEEHIWNNLISRTI